MENARVLGVLAGGESDPGRARRWAESADVVLAADGGANLLHALGIVPDATVGDLDSILPEALAAQVHVEQNADQNASDCDKLLGLADRLGHSAITLIGAEGDRLDHVLATLQTGARSRLAVRLVLRDGFGYVLRDRSVSVAARPGARASLLPLTACDGVDFQGVRWPLGGARLDPLGLVSLSNVVQAPTITAVIGAGAAVLFVQSPAEPAWE